MIDSQFDRKALDVLHGLIFDLLLVTDGRTTDLLEMLLNEKVIVHVIRQEHIGGEDTNLMGESSGGAVLYSRIGFDRREKSICCVTQHCACIF